MNLMYKYVDIYRDIYLGLLKKTSLYYQSHVINFHFWMTLLLFSFVKNLVDFNSPLWIIWGRYRVTINVGVFPYPLLACFPLYVLRLIIALYDNFLAFYAKFSW